jgi:hypothetical protein
MKKYALCGPLVDVGAVTCDVTRCVNLFTSQGPAVEVGGDRGNAWETE